ncbi:hypothetical protein QFC21_002781 [Naganishia friedmannii]|uniref:Uncharacterized protein n=1 Tax=Naganishia friedmannii TaxID=89922 RepID=A0ACC2VTC9_9TREE|nr:hypothetical protein QFC21_002781 [Naganishia friedmannii]
MSQFSQSFRTRDAAAQVSLEVLERPEGLVNTKPSPNFAILCRLFESLRDKPQKRKEQITSMIQVSRRLLWIINGGTMSGQIFTRSSASCYLK